MILGAETRCTQTTNAEGNSSKWIRDKDVFYMCQLRRIISQRSRIFKPSTILEIQLDPVPQVSDVISLKHEKLQHFVEILRRATVKGILLIKVVILAS